MVYVLPDPLPPLPGEALGSLILRNAHAFGFQNPIRLFARVDLGPGRVRLAAIRQFDPGSIQGELVRQVLSLSIDEFVRMSSRLARDGRGWIMGKEVDPIHLSRDRRRYCPMCLAEGTPYHRAAWDLLALTACPHHALLLQNRCPDCGRLVIWSGTRIECCSVSRCAGDLRSPPQVTVPLSNTAGAREIWDRLDAREEQPFPVEGLTFGSWLVLAYAMGALHAGILPGRRFRKSCDPWLLHNVLEVGFAIIRGWPAAVHADRDTGKDEAPFYSPQHRHYRILYNLQYWMRQQGKTCTVSALSAAISRHLFKRPQLQSLEARLCVRVPRHSPPRRSACEAEG